MSDTTIQTWADVTIRFEDAVQALDAMTHPADKPPPEEFGSHFSRYDAKRLREIADRIESYVDALHNGGGEDG